MNVLKRGSVRLESTRRTGVFPNPDGFRCFHTARCTLFGSASRFNLLDVTAVQVGLVFEECDELSPRRILLVPSVPIALKYPRNVEVFHEHGIVLADKSRRYLVLVIQHLPTNVTLDLGDLLPLFLIVV